MVGINNSCVSSRSETLIHHVRILLSITCTCFIGFCVLNDYKIVLGTNYRSLHHYMFYADLNTKDSARTGCKTQEVLCKRSVNIGHACNCIKK